MDYLNRFQRCILPHTNSEPVHAVSHPGSVLPVQSTAIWSLHSTHGVHCSGKGGQTDCLTKGYKDPPVPRRLDGKSQIPPNLTPACTDRHTQLDLKNNWRVPKTVEKVIPVPTSPDPHLKRLFQEESILYGQPLHPSIMVCMFLQMHQKKDGAIT